MLAVSHLSLAPAESISPPPQSTAPNVVVGQAPQAPVESLPFTGADILQLSGIGLAMVAAGYVARRRSAKERSS